MILKYSKKYINVTPNLLFSECEKNLLVIKNKLLLFLLYLRKFINIKNVKKNKNNISNKLDFKNNKSAFYTIENYSKIENYVKLQNNTEIYNSFFEIKTIKIDENNSLLHFTSTYKLKDGKKITGFLYFMIIFIVQRFFIYDIQRSIKRSLDIRHLNV